MAINFPDSPNNGDSFTSNNKTWVFDGTVWNITSGTNSVADGAITTAKIDGGAVTAVKIGSDAVTTAKILDANITTAKIASNAVTTAKILDANITEAKIESNAVTTGKLGTDVQLGYRNVIINGAMQVAQRGTSTASITGGDYYTADRFVFAPNSMGTWTNTIESDAPTGSGLRNSFKVLCTTADASPAAGDVITFETKLEGQNVQQFAKGTASAKQFALSFWVKSNVTGTYIAELLDSDNSRSVSASYTISASATWEKKTITFPADTTGVLNNDNATSLVLLCFLGAGTNYTSGTLATTWAANTNANRAVGQTNLASATSNYWQITGVQLEAGAVATPFEFEDIGVTFRKCRRYYHREQPGVANYAAYGIAVMGTSTQGHTHVSHKSMRVAPTSVEFSNTCIIRPAVSPYAITVLTIGVASTDTTDLIWTTGVATGGSQGDAALFTNNNSATGYVALNAEL